MFNQYVCYEIFYNNFCCVINKYIIFLLNKRIFFPRNQYHNDNKKGVMVNFPDIKIVFNIISHSQTLLKKGGEREDICSK